MRLIIGKAHSSNFFKLARFCTTSLLIQWQATFSPGVTRTMHCSPICCGFLEIGILGHSAKLATRNRYFAEIHHKGDLFLDPDTGIATGRVAHPEQYVQPMEIWWLLRD